MRTAKEMYSFSKIHTPIGKEELFTDGLLSTKPIYLWTHESFKVIESTLKSDEEVNFTFSARSASIYSSSEEISLINTAIAITNHRIIICGHNEEKLCQKSILEHEIISVSIEKCTEPCYEIYPWQTICFTEDITIYPWNLHLKNQEDRTNWFYNFIFNLQEVLNKEFTEKKKERLTKHTKDIGIKFEFYHIGWLIFAVACIAIIIYTIISALNNSTSVWDKEYDTCIICGGEMQCGMCGASGVYCENAQYGAGNAHYCSEHWADCCEWHEEQKNKR